MLIKTVKVIATIIVASGSVTIVEDGNHSFHEDDIEKIVIMKYKQENKKQFEK
jgi:hypothetical protein